MSSGGGTLEAAERILATEPEPDEALRQVVTLLHDGVEHATWVGLYFVEDDELVLGPWHGAAGQTGANLDVPVLFEGTAVAVIGIESDRADPFGAEDRALLERVAELIAAHCLVGWDTGGVPWPDVG